MSTATILLVDDDEVLGQVLQRVLSRHGWTVLQAGDVAGALRLAQQQRPDLGLLDLCLPDGDGVELATRLESAVGRFPLILMTAYPLRLRDHPELARQFARVLTKPLNLEELRQAVESTLAGAATPAAVAQQPPATVPHSAAPSVAHPPQAPVHVPVAVEAPAQGPRSPFRYVVPAALGLAVIAAGLFLVLPALGVPGLPNVLKLLSHSTAQASDESTPVVQLVPGKPDAFDLDPQAAKHLKVPAPVPVASEASPRRLELSGSLAFDPNLLGRIQSRFPGEVISIAPNEDPVPSPSGQTEPRRPLRYGDRVRGPRYKNGQRIEPGQLMAVVWSKDLGEKKSELVDGLVKLALDEENFNKLDRLYREGATSESAWRAAKNAVSADLNAIAKARRTLYIWRVEPGEITDVEREAERILAIRSKKGLPSKMDRKKAAQWARVEIRAPFDGIIVEKNLTTGNIVDTSFDLYKIADMRKLAMFANAYEEDQRILQDLQANRRPKLVPWRVFLNADPQRKTLPSAGIERIGYIVDPQQRTNLAIGLVENRDGRLRVGQSATAVVEIPPPPGVVSVPIAALVEDGADSVLFLQPDPKRLRFVMKRVLVTDRFQGQAYVSSQLSPKQKSAGLQELHPGEPVVTGSAVELKAALEDAQAKAKAKEAHTRTEGKK